MKLAIATIFHGELGEQYKALTLSRMNAYAWKVGAHVVLGQVRTHYVADEFANVQYAKLSTMHEALESYDRVLWLDADVIVTDRAPNIFDIVPMMHWAGFDEAAVFLDRTDGWRERFHEVHRHMKDVCERDSLAIPDSRSMYFNCGVQLAHSSMRELYEPPDNPDNHPWGEQSRVNVRLHLRPEIPVYCLPECFNHMMWLSRSNYLKTAWFIHYCGAPIQSRIRLMKKDLQCMDPTR